MTPDFWKALTPAGQIRFQLKNTHGSMKQLQTCPRQKLCRVWAFHPRTLRSCRLLDQKASGSGKLLGFRVKGYHGIGCIEFSSCWVEVGEGFRVQRLQSVVYGDDRHDKYGLHGT